MRPGDGNFAAGERQGRRPTAFEQVTSKWFHTCKISNKTIWPGQKAWVKTYYHYYNGKEAFSDWVSDAEYMMCILKGVEPVEVYRPHNLY